MGMTDTPRSARTHSRRIAGVVLLTALAGCDPGPGPGFEDHDEQVDGILAQMTLAEKIGQMTQADLSFIRDPAVVTELFLGSVLSGGNSDPAAGNTREAWADTYDRYQEAALATRLGIPILYGVDAVHGHSNVLGAVIFPHNIGLGATRDTALVKRVAEITATEMRATGMQWTFAPGVMVPRDERWGRTYEGFSEDPAIVSALGAAAVRGLQHDGDLANPLAVLATAKHYLGDGGTLPGTGGFGGNPAALDQGDMQLPEDDVRRIHLFPYRAAVAADVGSIMPSYSSWNGQKMSGHRYLLTDVLKGELDFEGFLISDYNAIQQLDPDFKTAIGLSVNAGMDMAMVPSAYRGFITHLTALVEEGVVPESRIDDAVRRILRVKAAMGLLNPDRSHLADRSLAASFGSAAHRAVAREAVRKSLVLLKNEGGVLPLSKGAGRIHVAGSAAADIGIQSGGWTIDWQGGVGEVTPGGTTILAAMRAAVVAGTEVTYSADGSGVEGASACVVVIGELPYAEGFGDRADLSVDAEQIALVGRMKDAGVPVVVVLLSGRPLILGDALASADAFLAAWLPGTEGTGVADVLFGDYAPTGKLSFTWPRTMDQIPINVGDAAYDPLFPLGYGLSY
jgi:beta-glucosidase